MAYYSTNELKGGMRVLIDQDPYAVVSNEYVKPGKGQAFNRIKLRNLQSGRNIERTLKSGDRLEVADVLELEVEYLYQDGSAWYFMDPKTYEQYSATAEAVEDAREWLKPQMNCTMLLFNGVPTQINLPNTVVLKVIEADPGVKGDTSAGGSKSATLETGVVIRVPLFIKVDDQLKIDPKTKTYLERVKD